MFGLGYYEIGLVILLLVVLLGGRRAGWLLGKSFGFYRKVDNTRREVRNSLNPLSHLKSVTRGKPGNHPPDRD